jgi:hypothetical protein
MKNVYFDSQVPWFPKRRISSKARPQVHFLRGEPEKRYARKEKRKMNKNGEIIIMLQCAGTHPGVVYTIQHHLP